jgi:hypothetical protein
MQLRREQQLEQILQQPKQVIEINEHQHHHVEPVKCEPEPERVVVSEVYDMREGPSSRDWMLVIMMVGGAIAITLALCLLVLVVMMQIGLIGGDAGSGAATSGIPLVR